MITARQLADSLGCALESAEKWAEPLNAAMERYQIDTAARRCAFLAQVGHESGRLIYVRELWNPSQCPWQAKYQGRVDLGNIHLGDGSRYRGRGLIQITGRANYRSCSEALGQDFETNPELLEIPTNAAMSAAWFWQSHGCNELADTGNFEAITRRINGGLNGYQDRLALLETATEALA